MIKLAAFDMDGTLIQGRLVFALADRFGLSDKIRAIQAAGAAGHEQTKAIAALFEGLSEKDIESAIESIPLTKNVEAAIVKLKEGGCKMGIISDSYTVAAGFVARKLDLDFVAANELEIKNGIITGRVGMPLGWEKLGCFCKISVCKRYHLEKYTAKFGVPVEHTLAVGDTRSDICMIRRAGVGVAFMPKDAEIAKATGNIVRDPDFMQVLEYAS